MSSASGVATMSTAAACCRPIFWLLVFLGSLATLAVLGLVAGLVVAVWLLRSARTAIAGLPTMDPPPDLLRVAEATGLADVGCVPSKAVDAFCVGALRPRVYVTTGLLECLGTDELRAVLAHEAEHARRRDPLRRALAGGWALSFFYLPVVRWWTRYDLEQSEVKADRRAIERVGRRPLAAALWRLDAEVGLGLVPTFAGAAEIRVAQILGDPLPRRAPGLRLWLLSALGITGFAYLLFCPLGGLFSH